MAKWFFKLMLWVARKFSIETITHRVWGEKSEWKTKWFEFLHKLTTEATNLLILFSSISKTHTSPNHANMQWIAKVTTFSVSLEKTYLFSRFFFSLSTLFLFKRRSPVVRLLLVNVIQPTRFTKTFKCYIDANISISNNNNVQIIVFKLPKRIAFAKHETQFSTL